jgi:hypothetical protein
MFSLRHWFSRSNESTPARAAAIEPLEGRALMSVSALPAVQLPAVQLPAVQLPAVQSPTGGTNIIAVLIGL